MRSSSSELCVVLKWSNQVLFGLSYRVQIKKHIQDNLAKATNEFQKSKKMWYF